MKAFAARLAVEKFSTVWKTFDAILLAICEQGSHLAMWDDQQTYLTYLLRFIKDNERGVKL